LETVGAPMDLDVPDPNKFPLLHSLGCNPSNMDCLIQELILFHGNNQISFTHGNNRQGTLVILPSHRHLDRYEAELSKKKSTLDTIVDAHICFGPARLVPQKNLL
jgi:hypothetical protein